MKKHPKDNEPSSSSNYYQKNEPSSSPNYYQEQRSQRSNAESDPPPADRPMSRPKGNPPEPLKIQFSKTFFTDGQPKFDNEKKAFAGKYYACETCSKVFSDDNWHLWPEGGCCKNEWNTDSKEWKDVKKVKDFKKKEGLKALDSESD